MTYVLRFFILRLRLRPTAEGRSLSGPNIQLRPKVKIAPTVQHWFVYLHGLFTYMVSIPTWFVYLWQIFLANFLTYNHLTIVSFRIGVPSVLFSFETVCNLYLEKVCTLFLWILSNGLNYKICQLCHNNFVMDHGWNFEHTNTNKRAGWNKRAGGIFFSKSINVQTKIKPCRGEFFLKINNRACTSIRYTRVHYVF